MNYITLLFHFQERNARTPPNDIKQAKRSQTCRSEPRLNSIRKSLRKKKRLQQKMNGPLPDDVKEVQQKNKQSNLEDPLSQNGDRSTQKAKLVTSNSSLNNNKTPLCHVQASSTESLKSVDNDIARNDFIKPEEVMAWLIKPIDTAKFFKYVFISKEDLLFAMLQHFYNDTCYIITFLSYSSSLKLLIYN